MIMKTVIISFLSVFSLSAQDSLQNPQWNFLNRFELSAYCLGIFDNAYSPFWGGNELHINAASYRFKQHEIGISTGAFYIGRKPRNAGNPTLHYFYFPINLNYRLYFNHDLMFGQVGIGTPLLIYEGSRYLEADDFWLNFERASNTPTYIKERIYGFHSLKFGYQVNKHLTLSAGEMSYLYATNRYKLRNLMRISFGVEFKL